MTEEVNDQLKRIRAAGVIAVLRATTPEMAMAAAEAIIRGKVTGIEM